MQTGRRTLVAALLVMVFGMASLPGSATESAPVAAAAGTPIDLASWKGKVVYLDFWASWCVPCRQSFPWMNAMQERYAKEGLVVVAVNMDQQRPDADAFLRQYPASFIVRFDPRGQLAQGFNLRGMPTSVLLDRGGKVLRVHEGFRGKDAGLLEDAIRLALH